MKHIAEQFDFSFAKEFFAGDKVVVKTDNPMKIKVMKVLQVFKLDMNNKPLNPNLLFLEDDKQCQQRMVEATDCRIATPLDYL